MLRLKLTNPLTKSFVYSISVSLQQRMREHEMFIQNINTMEAVYGLFYPSLVDLHSQHMQKYLAIIDENILLALQRSVTWYSSIHFLNN